MAWCLYNMSYTKQHILDSTGLRKTQLGTISRNRCFFFCLPWKVCLLDECLAHIIQLFCPLTSWLQSLRAVYYENAQPRTQKKIQISQGCMKKDWAILPKWLTKQQIMKRFLRQHKRTSLANRQGKRRRCLLTLPSASPSANTSNSSATNPQGLEILTHHPDPDSSPPPVNLAFSPERVLDCKTVHRRLLLIDLHFLSKTKVDNPTSYFRNLMAQIELLDTTHWHQEVLTLQNMEICTFTRRGNRTTFGRAEHGSAVGCLRLALKPLEASTRIPRLILACKHLHHITSFHTFKAEKMPVQ